MTERKLAAILSADVVGYSRLMADDDAETVKTLKAHKDLVGGMVRQHGGRVVDAVGDNLLADFPSVVDAVACAVAVQKELETRNEQLSDGRKMLFRIGINLGDVIVDEDRIYGDGVNIAARVQTLCEPGSISISGTAFDQVEGKLGLEFEDLGEHDVKNIPRPVRVYCVRVGASHEVEAAVTVPGFSGRPAIAVLAFDNLSGDPEQEYFADGIAEDLITRLSSWGLFPVIARNSSFVYKHRPVDVRQVSREIGARYVVEGSVRKAGNRVRISTQLIDATSGHHVWAELYDRDLSDVFALQDEITESIVASMHPRLVLAERDRVMRGRPQNLDAWECYIRASSHYGRFTKAENAQARVLFERAVQLDPRLVWAFYSLVLTHLVDLSNQWTDSASQSAAELERAAERAVAIDAHDPFAQVALGVSNLVKGQRDGAIDAWELAVELNPNCRPAYFWLGSVLADSGRPDDAISNLERAMRLSPQDPSMWMYLSSMASAHFAAERYAHAVDCAKRSLQKRRDWAPVYPVLAASYAHLSRSLEARQACDDMVRLRPDWSVAGIARVFSGSAPSFVERLRDGLRKAGLKEE